MSDFPQKPATPKVTGAAGGANGQIGSKLKAFYTALEQEPIPDLFVDLLEKLDAVEKAQKR